MEYIRRLLRLFFCYWLLLAGCLFLSGCATIPGRQVLPTYNIQGVSYLPLVSLCDLRNIRLEYDTFTKTAKLTKGSHKINLMVGDNLVLVDGKPLHLKHRMDIYQGTVVVPSGFKEQVIDVLFKETYAPAKATAVSYRIKKIVIDAGHGGTDPGAIGRTGLREKDATLDIAKRLSSLLRNAGFNVVVTRSSDRFIALSRRVDIANGSGADLFISIHANANRVKSLSGFEVYYISANANDYKRALSSTQNEALNLDSFCLNSPSLNLKTILWDMIHTSNRAESVELSRYLCRTINNDLNTRVIGTKSANFYVLKGVHMPAVLVEVGFLSNYDEECKIKNSYYRQQIAEAIADSIEEYAKNYTLAQGN